ncbi:MAG: SpoIVB peptidase [Clostridia bacterium]|nr:SpoIVB peptidase [Clostridia bacterium]
MKNTKTRVLVGLILSFYTLCGVFSTSASAMTTVSCEAQSTASYTTLEENEQYTQVLSDGVTVGSRILELLFGKDKEKTKVLAVGGGIFGIKLKQSQVSVVEARGIPALSSGDIILSVNGKEIKSADDVRRAVASSGGESVTVRALHKGQKIALELRPSLEDGEYKLGITLRDMAAGIGTITFIDPETRFFGGLGHGICDGDTGEVISMESGEVTGALLGGIHKGEAGKPGELTGILTDSKSGTLITNSECGVFGYLYKIPEGAKILEVATSSEVQEGEATILSTVKNGGSAEYKIEIFDIDRQSSGSKSFKIRVTDETLKALTGGIVRGMSGSPIIQNGKLVGAVTHVLVANPTEGYGIFIENMLNASNARNELPRAA